MLGGLPLHYFHLNKKNILFWEYHAIKKFINQHQFSAADRYFILLTKAQKPKQKKKKGLCIPTEIKLKGTKVK